MQPPCDPSDYHGPPLRPAEKAAVEQFLADIQDSLAEFADQYLPAEAMVSENGIAEGQQAALCNALAWMARAVRSGHHPFHSLVYSVSRHVHGLERYSSCLRGKSELIPVPTPIDWGDSDIPF
jgi:hypothetical protein